MCWNDMGVNSVWRPANDDRLELPQQDPPETRSRDGESPGSGSNSRNKIPWKFVAESALKARMRTESGAMHAHPVEEADFEVPRDLQSLLARQNTCARTRQQFPA